ncbi:hypothetical protein TIFTF001_030289 [Ficus carica]|uniref:Uncharacterized protein n=1 Tax=Ficus carica TaxID=3494 RepID=A0AA88DTV3_FICCA|nr:hypothetical protein TIFTF001_030289 [Ficus carica]
MNYFSLSKLYFSACSSVSPTDLSIVVPKQTPHWCSPYSKVFGMNSDGFRACEDDDYREEAAMVASGILFRFDLGRHKETHGFGGSGWWRSRWWW